ncbi:MAG: ABC transporter substrate-binding protein, partial [Dehalococcoidia bacterium]
MADHSPRRGGVLREAFDYEFSRMDPTAGAHIDPACCALYETVLSRDPTGAVAPMLAESWEISDDGLQWRLRINPKARFHSGDPCDAAAVVAAFERHRDPAEGRTGLFHWKPVKSITPAPGSTVVVELHHPCVRLPSVLRSWHAAVHNEATRARAGEDFGYSVVDGTGPFTLAQFEPECVRVERWAEYPGTGAPWFRNRATAYLDAVEWTPITDPSMRTRALLDGAVDCIQNPALEDVDRLRNHPDLRVVEFQQRSNLYLAVNFERTDLGFDDVRVRRALSHAMDRDRLVREAAHGHGVATPTLVGNAFEYYDPEVERYNQFDPTEATALLAAAGWTLGADGIQQRNGTRLTFELVGQDDPIHRRTVGMVVDMLRAIGVEASARFAKPFAPFLEAVTAGPAAFVSKWLWPDVFEAVQGFTASWSRPSPNWQHASLPDLDQAFLAWWS